MIRQVPHLMWVTDSQRSVLPIAQLAGLISAHGVDVIHVREKSRSSPEIRRVVQHVVAAVEGRAMIVVNSEPEIARELGVGVHYPENADIADEASGFPLVGRSVHSPESAVAIDGVDYVVAGHVFETGSKAGSQPLGVEGLAAIVAASSAPVLAIGGITPDRVQAVLETGAHGIAVMSGIVSAEDPARAAEAYRAALQVSKSKMQGTISMPISLTVNGKTVEIKRPLTIQAFLDSRNLHRNMVVVEHNGVILKKSQFGEVQLASGDVLEVVHFVGGG